MNLVIDTSSEKLKVILYNENKTFENAKTDKKHLKQLLPEIEALLTKNNTKLKDVNYFSVVTGPGSFTGIRIGVSTIKAFACVLKNKKYIEINMLELLAFTISQKNKVKNFFIIIKSTKDKFYFGEFNKNQLKTTKIITIEQLQELLKEEKPIYSYNCEELTFSTIVELETQDYINFNELKKTNKNFVKLEDIKPVYLALSQAEEELNKRLANGN